MYSPALSQIIPYLTLVDMGPDPLHSCHSLRVRSSPSRPLSVAAVNTTKATSTYLPPLSQSPPSKAPPTHSSKTGAISSPRLSFIEIAWLLIAAVECSGSRYNQNHLTSTYLHPSFPHLTPYKTPPTHSSKTKIEANHRSWHLERVLSIAGFVCSRSTHHQNHLTSIISPTHIFLILPHTRLYPHLLFKEKGQSHLHSLPWH